MKRPLNLFGNSICFSLVFAVLAASTSPTFAGRGSGRSKLQNISRQLGKEPGSELWKGQRKAACSESHEVESLNEGA